MYATGVRRIGVTTLPPMGCLPLAITLFGFDSNQCVERLNNDAINFNKKLNTTSQSLQKQLPKLNLAVLDIYQPLYQLVTNSSDNGKNINQCHDPIKSLLVYMSRMLIVFDIS